MQKLIQAQDALEKLNGKPAPLKGFAKFKAANPIKASIIKHAARGAAAAVGGGIVGGKTGAAAGAIIGGAL